MPDLSPLQDLLLLLGLALATAVLFSRVRQSPIIGYLVTGMLVGPYGFNLIKGVHEVEVMAEIGVILLLFTIGLEFSVGRILRLKGLMLKSGTAQVFGTIAIVFTLAYMTGLPASAAWGLGLALALSSTAIVLKLLLERGEIDSAHGRISLSVLLYQDLAVIFFILALPLLAGDAGEVAPLKVAGGIPLMGGLFVFSRYMLQPLLRSVLKTRLPEIFRLTILALVLGTAWITAQAGLSLALGAFLAGLALSESDYCHQVLSDILPFRDVFLSLFFVSMGMLVDIGTLAENWHLVLLFTAALFLVKTAAATAAGLLARYPLRTSLLSGLALFQVGEFSFILLKQEMALNILPEEVYQLTLAVIALSMMLTPTVFARAPALAGRLSRLFGAEGEEPDRGELERTGNLENHVIIAGYGVSGRNVGRVMREMHLPYIHVELNGETVSRARAAGEFIVYGDVTSPTVLEAVGIDRARAIVLAINDPSALARAIGTAREINPALFILARTRFVAELEHLTALGADEVVPDEFEASLQLAANLLRRFNIPEGQILKLLATLRQEHYGRLRQESPPSNLSGYLSVLEGGQIEFQALPGDSPCLGRTLAELEFRSRTGTMVVGVIRGSASSSAPLPTCACSRGTPSCSWETKITWPERESCCVMACRRKEDRDPALPRSLGRKNGQPVRLPVRRGWDGNYLALGKTSS